MQSLEKFKNIETDVPVESVQIGDVQIWPILRIKLFEEIRNQDGIRSRRIKLNRGVLKSFFKTFTYGLFNLTKLCRKEYWLFSASDRRKKIDGKYHDRVIEELHSILSSTIEFENPLPLGRHYPMQSIPNKDVISQTLLYLGTFMISFFYRFKKIKNETILTSLLSELKIKIDYRKEYAMFMGQYRLMQFLLFLHKPKAVIMVYTASSMGFIRALKNKNIPVIELQHGVVNSKHVAYNLYKKFDPDFFPDYFFCYGYSELHYFDKNNHFIKKKNVIPVGYSFLEKIINRTSKFSHRQKEMREKFKNIIVLSFQEPFAAPVLAFMKLAADYDKSNIYLIIPRNPNFSFDLQVSENIIIEKEMNLYDALQICDIHTTVNSTAVLEAFAFGKPTILIDIQKQASNYYNALKKFNSVKFTENPADFIRIVNEANFPESPYIKEEGNEFFRSSFKNNFKEAMDNLH